MDSPNDKDNHDDTNNKLMRSGSGMFYVPIPFPSEDVFFKKILSLNVPPQFALDIWSELHEKIITDDDIEDFDLGSLINYGYTSEQIKKIKFATREKKRKSDDEQNKSPAKRNTTVKTYKTHGLPPLEKSYYCSGLPSFQKITEEEKIRVETVLVTQEFKLVQKKFGLLDVDNLVKITNITETSELWRRFIDVTPNGLPVFTEGSSTKYTNMVVEEMLRISELEKEIVIAPEVQFSKEFRPDGWILRKNKTIIGYKEDKKVNFLGESLLDSKDTVIQIYSYLHMLHSVYGLNDAFVLSTDYDNWKVWFLPQSDSYAESNTLDMKDPQNLIDLKELHYSQTFKRDDKDLWKFILSVLIKMNNSKINPVLDIDSKRCYVKFYSMGMAFTHYPFGVYGCNTSDIILNDEKPINGNTSTFYACQVIGNGRDGRVFKVFTETKQVAVLKLSNKPYSERKKCLEKELEGWEFMFKHHRVPFAGYVTQVLNQPALIMPFFDDVPVKKPDFKKEDYVTQTDELIDFLSKNGKFHSDLKWDHVAIWNGKAVFLDLFSLEDDSNDSSDSINNASAIEMSAKLYNNQI